MSKILNFEEYKSAVEKNKIAAEKYVTDIENKLNEDLKKESKNIEENENINNFRFLMENFKKINNYLKEGLVTPLELQLISNKLYFVLGNEDYELSRIYIILCFYNALRIYKDKFLNCTDDYTKLITDLFVSFEESYDVTRLDSISNFIFNKNIIKKLENMSSDNEELFRRCERIVDSFLNSDINVSVNYYATKEIEFLEDSKKEAETLVPGFLGYGIRTPEFIQERLKEQLENMAFIFEKNEDKYLNLQSNIDMLIFKIKSMNEDGKKSFYNYVNKIDISENVNPLEKIERILNIADFLSAASLNRNDDEVRKVK